VSMFLFRRLARFGRLCLFIQLARFPQTVFVSGFGSLALDVFVLKPGSLKAVVFVLYFGSLRRHVFVLFFGSLASYVFVFAIGQKPRTWRGNALDIPASVVWVADVDVTKLVLCVHRPDRQAHQRAACKVKITEKELHNLAERMAIPVAWLGFFPGNLHKLALRVACPC